MSEIVESEVSTTKNNKSIKLKRDNQTFCSINPYPFGKYHNATRYIKDNILNVPESGVSDFIEPWHEYKAFINTPDENQLEKFITEVIRFAAACMNSRTNGTIHFGIGDQPDFVHGQIVGVAVNDKQEYLKALKSAIDNNFEHKHKFAAQKSIKTPRFVEVLNRNILSHEFVIEVDIEPLFAICRENIFHTFNMKKHKKKRRQKMFIIRDGASTRDLLVPTTFAKPLVEYDEFVKQIPKLSQLRKKAEEKHLDLTEHVVKRGPYTMNNCPRDKLIKLKRDNQTFCSINPYPFGKYRDTTRYIKDNILSVTESGTLDFIEPCHEYKAFINTPDEINWRSSSLRSFGLQLPA
ncbi:sterile alpha motif domain-containing protein 9-like [Poeciliopsis prolifica]|uniref:sterile alpha motif domain-containing protein 9-like n=1 Tax=Poeciliopsis prolifica TaxID=188132 RepID=UPI00241353D8|nr:sterile alpha motif domain-containing protein 9-like [Poeciliopsis prolifica]